MRPKSFPSRSRDHGAGRGLAHRLLDLHLRRLAGFGLRTVFLEVDEDNAPARRLYAGAGFGEVGRRPGYYAGNGGNTTAALVACAAILPDDWTRAEPKPMIPHAGHSTDLVS